MDWISRLSEKTTTKKNTDTSGTRVTRSTTTFKRRKATFFDSYEDEVPDLADCCFDHEDLQYYFDADLEFEQPFDPFTFDELQVDLTSVVCISQTAVSKFSESGTSTNDVNIASASRALLIPATSNSQLHANVCVHGTWE